MPPAGVSILFVMVDFVEIPTADAALRAQHRLAHAYRAARRFEEALRWFRAAARESAALYGASDWRTLRYRSSLANCYYAAGAVERAAEMFYELLDVRRATLGAAHPDTQRSRGSLANALAAAGRYDAAAAVRAGGDGPMTYEPEMAPEPGGLV